MATDDKDELPRTFGAAELFDDVLVPLLLPPAIGDERESLVLLFELLAAPVPPAFCGVALETAHALLR